MNRCDFINKAVEISKQKTVYGWGCFGQKATDSFINQKATQYPSWYTREKINSLKALSDDTLMIDCVGLIKMILWGYPNTKYVSNGVPDTNANGMIKICESSTDFSKIIDGSVVWMDGHIGIYVGNGNVIESTPNAKFGNGVVTTKLIDRKWVKWGKLPYVEYNVVAASPKEDKLKDFLHELKDLIGRYE